MSNAIFSISITCKQYSVPQLYARFKNRTLRPKNAKTLEILTEYFIDDPQYMQIHIPTVDSYTLDVFSNF